MPISMRIWSTSRPSIPFTRRTLSELGSYGQARSTSSICSASDIRSSFLKKTRTVVDYTHRACGTVFGQNPVAPYDVRVKQQGASQRMSDREQQIADAEEILG